MDRREKFRIGPSGMEAAADNTGMKNFLYPEQTKTGPAPSLGKGALLFLGLLGVLPGNDAVAAGSPYSSATGPASGSASAGGHGLAQEWEPNIGLKSYKQNYLLLYAASSQPNNQPTSPNPQNTVLTPYALDNKDMKFQISFKHILADNQQYGAWWFAYTQLSLWQYYDTTNSRPFRESNYEPEFIYSFRPSETSILNFGAVHQSNGESNPRSRSWERVYIKPGMEFQVANGRLIFEVRWWLRVPEDPVNDNNPDMTNYIGTRDIEIRYEQENGWKLNVLARNLATQVDIAAPFTSWIFLSDSSSQHLVDLHLQYFNGYGESLLDYNQSHVTTGIGISFPF